MEKSDPREQHSKPHGARHVLWVTTFVTGFMVMAFEMLGSRYLTPYFGGSVHPWALLSVAVFAGEPP